MKPRFLADHDLNEAIVTGVRRAEPAIEFLRVRDFGLEETADADILDFAAEQGLIVVSHDVNTMTAAAYARMANGDSIPGLFLVRQTSPVTLAIDDLVMIWMASEHEEWLDQVRFLPI